jgi:hypothetical protein
MHVFQINAGEVVPLAFHDDLLYQGSAPTWLGTKPGLREYNKKIGEL